MLDFMLILHRQRLSEEPGDLWIVDQCLELSMRITDTIEGLTRTQVLQYLQDTSSYMTSSTVVLLEKVKTLSCISTDTQLYDRAAVTQKQMILQQLQRLMLASSEVSIRPDAPTAYTSRLIKRVLSRIRDRSVLGSPTAAPPNELSGEYLGDDLSAIFAGMVGIQSTTSDL